MIFERFLATATAAPRRDVLALTSEHESVTFGALAEHSRAFAAWLGAANRRPLVVTALCGGPSLTAVVFGSLGAGAPVVPLPDKATPHEAGLYLDVVQPDVLVVENAAAAAAFLPRCEDATTIVVRDDTDSPASAPPHRHCSLASVFAGAAPPPPARHGSSIPAAAALIQFTSGSTSRPKGILLSDANLCAHLDASEYWLRGFRDEPVFCPLPQFHAMCGTIVLEHLAYGSPVHVANTFLPGEDLARIARHGCAAIVASPSWFKLMLRVGALPANALPRLRSFTLGTAGVDRALVEQLRAAFADAVIRCRYGMSEAFGPLCSLELGPGELLEAEGLVGRPVPGVELAPGLPGPDGEPAEVRVRTAAIGIGQLVGGGEVAPLAGDDGWLGTGDFGVLDAQGRVHLRGRASSFLKYSGHRVSPFEIEALLRSHPGVHEAVVVGLPDPLVGQRIVACIEPDEGAPAPDHDALTALCHAGLSPHKVPQRFVVFARLPRTASGKPDRSAILAAVLAQDG